MTPEQAILSAPLHRAFRPEPVARGVVERILDIAARAPSAPTCSPGGACAGRRGEGGAVRRAARRPAGEAEYRYYPERSSSPISAAAARWAGTFYGLLGIARGETRGWRPSMPAPRFFGAPVGLIFTIDRRLGIGSWLDYGMFLEM